MYKLAWLLMLFAVCFTFAADRDRTPAPLSPHEAAQSMRVPDGFSVTLVASEPDVVQPISFCFDDRGRLFVAEALNYGEWQATGNDRIVILDDSDGDGRAEKRKVFFEGLNYVTGIEVGFGGVWVMSPPNLYFIADGDGDDVPDGEPKVLFDGFGYQESRHNLANGFTWGPDGWLYAGHGRTSPSDVGRPGTPADKRIHCDGGVYRIHPTTLVFENFADGTTNPWGVDFDDYGQCFVSNCVNPHLFHVIQGAHYEPWRNRPSSLYAYERIPTVADHLHYPSNQPKAMRGETAEVLAMGGGHAHCGTLIYLGDTFPESYRNSVFMCNVHGRRINNDLLRRKRSGYTASHGPDFMIASDPWFMGVTLRTGPDGGIFVSDWSDTGECHTYKPERGTGRIYRINYGPSQPKPVDLRHCSDLELAELQMHRNDWYVCRARRLLQERASLATWDGADVHAKLEKELASNASVPRRLRALWALQVTGGLQPQRLIAQLDDKSEHIRAWSVQLLCEPSPAPSEATLQKFAVLAKQDPSPIVRLYLAAALQRLPLDQRLTIAEGLASHAEDAEDTNLPLMIWYGVEPVVPEKSAAALQFAAAASIPRLREFVARRFVDHAVLQGEKTNLDPLAETLATAGEAAQHDLLRGVRDGLLGQKEMPMPEAWPNAYRRLMANPNPEVRELAGIVALTFGDRQAMTDLRRAMLDTTLPVEQRRNALQALVGKGLVDLAPTLHELLGDTALCAAAIRGLAVIPNERTPQQILTRYAQLSVEEKQEAIATLSSRKSYATALLDAIEKENVPRSDISAYAARQLNAIGDRALTERLRKVWGEVRDTLPQKREQLDRYKRQLSDASLKNADLENGRAVYAKTCQQCHIMFGEGSRIGPDLTGSNRANLDYILSNIIDPSAEIGRDYRMSVVSTKDGRILTGMIVESTPARLTIQAATERIVLPRDDVDDIQESQASMMPEGQLEQLTRDQIRDLIAYLASPKQVSLPTVGSGSGN